MNLYGASGMRPRPLQPWGVGGGLGNWKDTVFSGRQKWTASMKNTSDHPCPFRIGNFSGKHLGHVIPRLQITPPLRTLLLLLDP